MLIQLIVVLKMERGWGDWPLAVTLSQAVIHCHEDSNHCYVKKYRVELVEWYPGSVMLMHIAVCCYVERYTVGLGVGFVCWQWC
jgi:hypothetical protein